MPFYLHAQEDEFDKLPVVKVCLAEALYDIESILSDPGAYPDEELCKLRDQIVSNLERAWGLVGGSEDELTGTLVQISQVVARQFRRDASQP